MSARVYITGNIGQQPEVRFTQSGNATLTLSIGCTPRRKDRNSDRWEDDGAPLWITVTLWGDEAERLADVLHTGDRVSVNGILKRRVYDRRDGGQGESLELVGARDLAVIPKPDSQPATQKRDSGQGKPGWVPPGREPVNDPWAAQKLTDGPPPF